MNMKYRYEYEYEIDMNMNMKCRYEYECKDMNIDIAICLAKVYSKTKLEERKIKTKSYQNFFSKIEKREKILLHHTHDHHLDNHSPPSEIVYEE